MIYSYFIVVLVLSLVSWLFNRRHLYILSWKLPGPFAWPVLGNGLSLFDANRSLYFIDEICRKYSSPLRIWIGPKLFVFVYDVRDVELILKSPHCLNKIDIYKFAKDGIGDVDGLFTAEASVWKQHKKLIASSFGLNVIYTHLPIFNKHARKLAFSIGSNVGEFDIRAAINVTTVDIFLDSTLGSELSTNNKLVYSNLFNEGQKIVSKRLFQPWYQVNWIWNLTKYPQTLKNIRDICFNLIDDIVKKKKTEGSESLTFIDRLIRISEENPNFTIHNIRAETQTLLIGASDTSSLTAAFTILMLAIHPSVQDRVYNELKCILPETDVDITKEHLEKMTYLEQCIKETLRLFPTGSLIGRSNDKAIKLKNVEIPRGTSFIIALRQLMRSIEHWGQNANQFDPDHFSPENLVGKTAFHYIPFSEGPRNCIGERYAMIVMKVMIAQLIKQYFFKTSLRMDSLYLRMDINIRLLSGHMVQAYRRTK